MAGILVDIQLEKKIKNNKNQLMKTKLKNGSTQILHLHVSAIHVSTIHVSAIIQN